jgi:hypothetical protein
MSSPVPVPRAPCPMAGLTAWLCLLPQAERLSIRALASAQAVRKAFTGGYAGDRQCRGNMTVNA